jgi:hypothetical protein
VSPVAIKMITTRDRHTGRTSKIISEIFQDSDATLSLKYDKIEAAGKTYVFNYPVLFQIYQEGKGTIIENEQLDIYASGKSITEAKSELSNQFSHSYNRLNQLKDEQLNPKLLSVKGYYNFIVKAVIDT